MVTVFDFGTGRFFCNTRREKPRSFWVLSIFACLHSRGLEVSWEKGRNYMSELASRNSCRSLRRMVMRREEWPLLGTKCLVLLRAVSHFAQKAPSPWNSLLGEPHGPSQPTASFPMSADPLQKDTPFQSPRWFASFYLILPSLVSSVQMSALPYSIQSYTKSFILC